MPVQLQPEIYRLIIKALVSSDEGYERIVPFPFASIQALSLPPIAIKQDHQSCLAKLMRVSKTMYELCKTELYNDCLVGDIDTFAQDIESNLQKTELLAQIKTLRVYQADQLLLKEPTYAQLVSDPDEWRILGPRLATVDEFASLRLAVQDDEFADRFFSGPAYRSLRVKVALPNLERVTMTREAETFPWGVLQVEFDTFNEDLNSAPLPFFLANLPNVSHYCQWSPTGPLAFPNRTIKIDNPPNIITIHAPSMLETLDPFWFPPIVLDATNRLMFNNNKLRCSNVDMVVNMTYESNAPYIVPLQEMFGRVSVIQATNDGYENVPFESVSLDNTRVELYDYVRHCTFTDMFDMDSVDSRPTDLSEIQSVLDEKIGRWKGKVFLKNREDCPPCSACGFEGFWKY